MRKHDTYIGVSGVVNREQQDELSEIVLEVGLNEKYLLQCGVKATHKPQYLEIENKYGREWYPVGDEITTTLQFGHNVMGVAQICFDNTLIYDMTYRREFMRKALGGAMSQWLTGVQFDMIPDWCTQPDLLTEIIEDVDYALGGSANPLSIAIQCQRDIMEHHSPNEIVDVFTRDLSRSVDYILFDASGGRGIRMNTEALLPYIDAVYTHPELTDVGIVVAGGLNAGIVRTEIPKITRHFPAISWDAEGQLHPVNEFGRRPLNMDICRDYLEASAEVLE